MSESRFQVFVSSTFRDLREERQQVQQALLQMDCIPAGMELFPATDEEQWQFIRKVIDDCDYYIVLVAGRYGSTTADGVSYTEREFDYAVERELPILAFLHADPDSIPAGQSELDAALRQRLAEFRDKVTRDRLIKNWRTPSELAGMVALSLTKLIKTRPSRGWVRGPATETTDLLRELNELRKRNEDLESRIQAARKSPEILVPDLAPSTERFELRGTVKPYPNHSGTAWSAAVTWEDMLYHIGPALLQWTTDSAVNGELTRAVLWSKGMTFHTGSVDHENFKTVRIQLMALNFVDIEPLRLEGGGSALFWRLTAAGRARLMQIRTVKVSASGTASSVT